jgi:hypothetical protein
VGLAFCGEYLVPGGSNLVTGDFKQAAVHSVLGFAAGAVFGWPAVLLVSSHSMWTAIHSRRMPPARSGNLELVQQGAEMPVIAAASNPSGESEALDAGVSGIAPELTRPERAPQHAKKRVSAPKKSPSNASRRRPDQ